jgi:hypothetical protein
LPNDQGAHLTFALLVRYYIIVHKTIMEVFQQEVCIHVLKTLDIIMFAWFSHFPCG